MHDLFIQFSLFAYIFFFVLRNLTHRFQTPALNLCPVVVSGVSWCYSKAQNVPPREPYVLFWKYYLIAIVSTKNKCSYWSTWLAAFVLWGVLCFVFSSYREYVFTSQAAASWIQRSHGTVFQHVKTISSVLCHKKS